VINESNVETLSGIIRQWNDAMWISGKRGGMMLAPNNP
jgi:hypothetical protein